MLLTLLIDLIKYRNIINYVLHLFLLPMENMPLILSIGFASIFITILICLKSKKTKIDKTPILDSGRVSILKFNTNVFFLVYLFLLIMMCIIGILSEFYEIVLAGGSIALIPLIIMILFMYKKW